MLNVLNKHLESQIKVFSAEFDKEQMEFNFVEQVPKQSLLQNFRKSTRIDILPHLLIEADDNDIRLREPYVSTPI